MDFSGKDIAPFCTSGGSGLGKTSRTLQEVVPAASVREGKMLNGGLDAAELKQRAGISLGRLPRNLRN